LKLEKIQLMKQVDILKTRVQELEQQNKDLRTQMDQGMGHKPSHHYEKGI
jgi:chaperonin cofactor prefoldin